MTNEQSRVIVASGRPEPEELSFLSKAVEALSQANTFDEVKNIRDQAEAARAYARSALLGLAIQNQAAEIKIRAERKAGRFLADSRLRGGSRRGRITKRKLRLKDLGITHKQSERWQLEASVSDRAFEEYVGSCRKEEKEISSAAVLRLARKIRQSSSDGGRRRGARDGLGEAKFQLARCAESRLQFGCFYVRPHWPRQWTRTSGLRERTLREATREIVNGLRELPIQQVAAERSHLHLYTPCHALRPAMSLIAAWGYEYQGALAVIQPQGTFGPYWRASCELILLGVRGALPFRDSGLAGYMDGSTSSEREVIEMLSRVSPGPYLSLFANDEYSGWTSVQAHSTSEINP